MPLKHLLSLKGINYWVLASAIALNLFWTLVLVVVLSALYLQQVQGGEETVGIFLLVASFLGPFFIGWLSGALAADGRGPTYGIYGSLSAALILAFVALPAGIMGLMLVVVTLAGGLNGGLFSVRGRLREK